MGYGGTKTEMERLLADAQALTGVKYDINNLGDVYNAIHAIQGELGLTGVAAKEAETTLTGSFNAVAASWTNVMAALTTGEGMDEAMANLTTSVTNFANNVLQALSNVAPQVPALILGILDAVIANAPNLIAGGVEMIAQLVVGFIQAVPNIISQMPGLFTQMVLEVASLDWASIGRDIVMGIVNGVIAAAQALIESVKNMARRALEGARSELDIGSPSRAFANEIGRWIPPGIAVGIDDNMAPLNTSIAAASQSIVGDMARATAPGNIPAPAYSRPQPQSTQVSNTVHIVFEGSLAQLGRILQPHIKAEEERRGPLLIK